MAALDLLTEVANDTPLVVIAEDAQSSSSRMNAAMYTSPTTFGAPAPATVITALPYE
jgi:hypothetical protein